MKAISEKDKKLSWRLVASIVCLLLAAFFFWFREKEPVISAIFFSINLGLAAKNFQAHRDIMRRRRMYRDSPRWCVPSDDGIALLLGAIFLCIEEK